MSRAFRTIAELASVLLLPAVLAACVLLKLQATGLLSMLACIAGLLVFFAGWERSETALRQIMPPVVLSAVAAAGRVAFVALPNIQPVTAICVMSGVVFGRRCGYMTGALAGLVSSAFLGFGAWTPWQMYGWALAGYLAGVVFNGRFRRRGHDVSNADWDANVALGPKAVVASPSFAVCAFGFAASLLFGFVMNTWMVLGFVQPSTLAGAAAIYIAGAAFDMAHAVSTVVFLALLYAPWGARLRRLSVKYGL